MFFFKKKMSDTFLIRTEIKPSTIENGGNGRFFQEDVKKGTMIRKQVIGSESLQIFKNQNELNKIDIDTLKHYAHSVPKDCRFHTNSVFINHPYLYTNHNCDSNVQFQYTYAYKYTITTKDVKKGEEMFQDYFAFKAIDWFEKYLKEKNIIGAREFAQSLAK